MRCNKIYVPDDQIDSMKSRIMNAIEKDENSGCWVLTKYFHKKGTRFSYCKMKINVDGVRESYFVHRLSYHLFKGDIPDGALILHKCNNYKCCNPDHLYPGDHKQNLIDCKNSGNENKAVGERNNKAKFKEEDIRKIFILNDMGFSQHQIARLYKVAHNNIGKILNGISWKHLKLTQGGSDEKKSTHVDF